MELAPGFNVENGVVTIDPDIAYPAIMTELKIAKKDLDQYWAEIIYQCAKLEAMRLVANTDQDPRPQNALRIIIESRKDKWAINKLPEGRGTKAATAGREAREIYRNWRGFIPN
jgi:hypothetical protein